MSLSKPNPWLVVACVSGALYPLLAYWGMTVLPPQTFIAIGLVFIGMRLFQLRRSPDFRIWQVAFLIAAAVLIGISFLNAHMAALVYPVVIGLSVSTVFALSLFFPPTVVERIARLSEPDLSPRGVIYTRRITAIWAVFLLINALISAATALWGTLAQWTLWNGLVSYLLMGALFLGEMAVRRMVRP